METVHTAAYWSLTFFFMLEELRVGEWEAKERDWTLKLLFCLVIGWLLLLGLCHCGFSFWVFFFFNLSLVFPQLCDRSGWNWFWAGLHQATFSATCCTSDQPVVFKAGLLIQHEKENRAESCQKKSICKHTHTHAPANETCLKKKKKRTPFFRLG